MAEYMMYVGRAEELITDSQRTREVMEKLVAEASAWASFLPSASGRLRSALEELREWVMGARNPGDPNNVVTIFRRAGQNGPNRGLNAGDEIRGLRDIHHADGTNWIGTPIWVPWNDRIQAINIREGYFCALYEHDAFGGNRLIITGPARIMDLGPMNFNDRASSLLIYPITNIRAAW